MGYSGDLLTLAALLERAYGLALVVQDAPPSEAEVVRQAAVELVDVLDDARVTLLTASRLPKVV
jgi:hypothetical protein